MADDCLCTLALQSSRRQTELLIHRSRPPNIGNRGSRPAAAGGDSLLSGIENLQCADAFYFIAYRFRRGAKPSLA